MATDTLDPQDFIAVPSNALRARASQMEAILLSPEQTVMLARQKQEYEKQLGRYYAAGSLMQIGGAVAGGVASSYYTDRTGYRILGAFAGFLLAGLVAGATMYPGPPPRPVT